MKILVTGGAGFIGSNLIDHMTKTHPEWELVALDDVSTGDTRNLATSSARLITGSILSPADLADAMDGVDKVVHLAAIPSVPRSIAAPVSSHEANASGTLAVLEAARSAGVDQVVVASSSSVYGSNPTLPKSEFAWTRPMSPYAVSKLATEAYTVAYNYSYGMKNLAFRFFNVYGPRQAPGHAYAAVIPQFVDAALRGQPLTVHGDGQQSRDFTFVGTVCAVITDAISRGVTNNDPMNLAFGTNTTLADLISMLEESLSTSLTVEHVETRRGDVRASQADSSLLRSFFPDIQPVPLEEGLALTVDWFRSSVLPTA